MKTIIEPFRIKMTEPIRLLSQSQRKRALKKAHHNVFLLDAADCAIDLLTDSGTGAMSSEQWAALMRGDESYAGGDSWKRFESTVKNITGMPYIFPTHQGRAAEHLLASMLIKKGHVIPNNAHFDTTRANLEVAGAQAVDCPNHKSEELTKNELFKGNMNIELLEQLLKKYQGKVPFGMITVTNNTCGGQPVSLENIKATKELLNQYGIPLVLDACRFAENAYLIQQHEKGQKRRSLKRIAKDMFNLADAATMSCKKDGLANIGGFFVCRNPEWADHFRNLLILREGFPTYGGLSGRDLEVISVGLNEVLNQDYQVYRHATMEYFGDRLQSNGIPHVRPIGGHAIFLDASQFVSRSSQVNFPGISVVNALYEEGGVRSVELGSAMFGKRNKRGKERKARHELVRLAFPRRVYTQSHVDYLLEVLGKVWEGRERLVHYQMVFQAPWLRHFTCHYRAI